MKIPETKSNDSCDGLNWLRLDLPTVTAANAPVEHPTPGPALAFRHSLTLSRSVSEAEWEQRRSLMNPERFSL